MGYISFLGLSLCALVLFNGCFALIAEQQSDPLWQLGGGQSQLQWIFGGGQQQQQRQRRMKTRSECQFERITARQPARRIESEAGLTEFWDSNNEEFVCVPELTLSETLSTGEAFPCLTTPTL